MTYIVHLLQYLNHLHNCIIRCTQQWCGSGGTGEFLEDTGGAWQTVWWPSWLGTTRCKRKYLWWSKRLKEWHTLLQEVKVYEADGTRWFIIGFLSFINVCVFQLIMELVLSSTQIDDSPHSNAQPDRQEGQRSSLCLVGVEDRVPVDGPIRAAFIHTRLQSFGEARFREVHKYRLGWVSFGNGLRVQSNCTIYNNPNHVACINRIIEIFYRSNATEMQCNVSKMYKIVSC